MKGLVYCKNTKPYLLSSNYENSMLYYYSDRTNEKETMMLTNDNKYKYVAKNGKLIGEADFDYIGQAMKINNITLYNEEKDLSNLCEHKKDSWTKVIVEKEIYAPRSDRKVYQKGEFREDKFIHLLVFSSQELYDIFHNKNFTRFKK